MAIPVTVLSGTLGAGKTTTLNHVLTADHGHEVAVLVNDMGEINVDADRLERRVDEAVVELSNGCICCGMQGELEQAVIDLALREEFDYLLVEPSGISEPKPVAERFVRGRAAGFYELDSVTTVVDARQFSDAFGDDLAERRGETDGAKALSDLIVEGVEFCDTLVLNKTDLVDDDELASVRRSVRTLQPKARLLETTFGRIDPDLILGTGRFDARTVDGSAGWKRALEAHAEDSEAEDENEREERAHDGHGHDGHDHAHPPDVYGVDSFLYDERRPMHPERLGETLSALPGTVLRAKGLLHVAGRPEYAMNLSAAGGNVRIDVSGRWIASLPERRRESYRGSRDPDWDEEYGDRRTRLVVIGRGMDSGAVEASLDACLCTDEELDAESLDADNPFPRREGDELAL